MMVTSPGDMERLNAASVEQQEAWSWRAVLWPDRTEAACGLRVCLPYDEEDLKSMISNSFFIY